MYRRITKPIIHIKPSSFNHGYIFTNYLRYDEVTEFTRAVDAVHADGFRVEHAVDASLIRTLFAHWGRIKARALQLSFMRRADKFERVISFCLHFSCMLVYIEIMMLLHNARYSACTRLFAHANRICLSTQ